MTKIVDFRPDWISPPGDTIADIIEERNLSLIEFAEQMGQTPKHIDELLHGRTMITIETARRLEVVLGSSAVFWMIRDSQYHNDIARLQSKEPDSVVSRWLTTLPLKDMVKFGWLRRTSGSTETLAECLRFFGVSDIGTWDKIYQDVFELCDFRISSSFNSELGSIAAWLRQSEIESASIECKRWDSKQFQEVLLNIRSLTRKKDPRIFIPELVKRCAECGVAVVIVRAPKGCRASGATRFLSPNKALLVLSFRYLSDDHFWFTFFHEAGHLLLHGKKSLFLEGDNITFTKKEKEANDFAAYMLIPPQFQANLSTLPINSLEIIKFSRRVGVAPGIVVGQLQHLGRLKLNQLNSLKRRFSWNDD
ncbi:MAG: ImmA/IrrE family metallo-endopeptidase [Nitrospiria bacterium]